MTQMFGKVRCGLFSCNKVITTKTEVEYSQMLGEYFCNADCATDRYFDYMTSTPLDTDDLEYQDVEIKKGVLYHKG